MKSFTILVLYTAKNEGDREMFVKELTDKGVLDAIRNEDGCLAYEYYCSYEDARVLALYEKWESPEHQRVHMTQPHMKAAMEIKGKYIDSVKLKKIEISDL